MPGWWRTLISACAWRVPGRTERGPSADSSARRQTSSAEHNQEPGSVLKVVLMGLIARSTVWNLPPEATVRPHQVCYGGRNCSGFERFEEVLPGSHFILTLVKGYSAAGTILVYPPVQLVDLAHPSTAHFHLKRERGRRTGHPSRCPRRLFGWEIRQKQARLSNSWQETP
jgi:hypothetical protein